MFFRKKGESVDNLERKEGKRPRYDLVLLDADNTIFDFDAAEERALERTLAERGGIWREDTLDRYRAVNQPLWDAFHRGEITQEWLTVERFRRFGAEYGVDADPEVWNRAYLDRLGECAALLPGALELLETLKPHVRLALATNGLTVVQKKRLKNCPATPYFERVFISQEMGVGKPDRGYFDRILTEMAADPARTVMVGDSLLSDIPGAINAGIDNIWFTRNGEKSDLPTYTVGRLEEVPAIVLGG